LPQLAIETYASQIFWVLIGFLVVYLFISTVVTPSLEETLGNRMQHVDNLVKTAAKLKNEAEALEKEAGNALENAFLESYKAESELVSLFREKSIREKSNLHEMFSRESKLKSATLAASAEKAFQEVAASIEDTLLEAALEKISSSVSMVKTKEAPNRKL
jgi:F-type H+-transporting ATPase subunit b